jgi:penicillin-binding protein 1C
LRPEVALRRAACLGLAALAAAYLGSVASRAHLDDPAPTPIVYDRDGTFLAQLGNVNDGRTEYGFWRADAPPERVVMATLALEDRRFWSHPGVDPAALLRAVWQRLGGAGHRSGASTIAMQVARMQHPAPRTLWAKAVEAGTALALTARYGRAAVLAQYFRLAPYGNGSHGIGHAARWYFGKPAGDLGWAEVALLAAVPQAPATHNPRHPTGLQRARARAGFLLDALARAGTLSGAEHDSARAQLAVLRPGPAPRRPGEAMHAILRLRSLALSVPDPTDARIIASLDLGLQRRVAALLRRDVAAWRGRGAQQAAAMVIRRDTQEVLAAVGSTGWADPRGGRIDFTHALRSPGSTLKPFIYADALRRGMLRPAELLDDSASVIATIGNADGAYLGRLPARQALANSRNVPAAELLRRIGLGRAFDLFTDLGLHDRDGAAVEYGLSMAIGGLPTRMDLLAHAYAALADDGVMRDLVWYRGQPETPPARLFSKDAARQVALYLSDPLARLPSFSRYGSTEYPFTVAVKTGTSQGYRDAWTVAWSEKFLVLAWVGRADGRPMANLGGSGSAALIVREILLGLHAIGPGQLAETGFVAPEGSAPLPVCAGPDAGPCNHTLLEYLPARPAAAPLPPAAPAIQLSIAAPAANSHIWRNPESPPIANRLILTAKTEPHVRQVVWYVDDAPFALGDPDEHVAWPMTPGEHRFQIGLPLRPERSRPVRVVVE